MNLNEDFKHVINQFIEYVRDEFDLLRDDSKDNTIRLCMRIAEDFYYSIPIYLIDENKLTNLININSLGDIDVSINSARVNRNVVRFLLQMVDNTRHLIFRIILTFDVNDKKLFNANGNIYIDSINDYVLVEDLLFSIMNNDD